MSCNNVKNWRDKVKSKYRLLEIWHERTGLNGTTNEYYEYIMFFNELVPILFIVPPRAIGLTMFERLAAKSPNCKILVTLRKTNEPYFK